MYNRFLRWAAKMVGIIGRGLGLSSIPRLKNIYLVLARPFLPDHDVWVAVGEQQILLPSPRTNVLSRMVYLFGSWEEPVTRCLCANLLPGMTAVDVGAHIGYFTLVMAGRTGTTGRVFAFEPNPEVQKYLRENLRRNGCSQVTVCPVALFRDEGSGTLEGSDGLNARLTPHADSRAGGVTMAVFDRFAPTQGIAGVDLVKMDVEGAELDILLGMRRLLSEDHPSFVIEVHPRQLGMFGHTEAELRGYLESCGYSINIILRQIETTTVHCVWNGSR
jgi:FkbM family methyltransferase